MQTKQKIKSAFFITFNGNCRKALMLYQTCFGGELSFDTFKSSIVGLEELPVVSGFLISDKISIYGSDLVHNEGRRTGNHIAMYVQCDSHNERLLYLQKLDSNPTENYEEEKLIEIVDAFDVVWVFGV